MTATEFTPRRYRDEDESSVLALLRAAFGCWPFEAGLADVAQSFFRWKHFQSPWGPSELHVVDSECGVVAIRGYLPRRLRVGGATVFAYEIVDGATHPSFQGHGLAQLLTEFGAEVAHAHPQPEPALMLATPHERGVSLAARVPTGFSFSPHVLGRLCLSVRVNTAQIAKREAGEPLKRRSIRAHPVAAVMADSSRVEPLLEQISAVERGIATDRTVDYLRWRYTELLPYHAVVLERGSTLRGLAIIREKEDEWGFKEARLLEFLVSPDDAPARRELLRKVLRATDADWVTAHFPPGSPEAEAVNGEGFQTQADGWCMLVYLRRDDLVPDPRRIQSWSLTFGDIEGEII